MTGYSPSQPLVSVPWGDDPGQLPYVRTDMGGLGDDFPTRLVAGRGGLLWLGYGNSGALWLLDTAAGRIGRLDWAAALPSDWRGGVLYSYGIANDPRGGLALLAGGRDAGSSGFAYRIVRYDAQGRPAPGASLDRVVFGTDGPEHLAIDVAGRGWLQSGAGTLWIIAPDGEPLAHLPGTTGVLLSSGRFLTNTDPPRLLDEHGRPVAEFPPCAELDQENGELLAAGPDGLILVELVEQWYEGRKDPEDVDYLIARVDAEQQQITTLHRFRLPILRLQPDANGVLQDGSRISIWFPPAGMAFTDNGDLLLLEITPRHLQLYRIASRMGSD